ncbi:MAG: FHA domain-containing protein [Candidatus Aminicenantes bacterium]|jgi:hypothetical protein
MEICSNCFKKSSQASPFCPYCGYPYIDIGLKRCAQGHIIYETYKNCPFCHHLENLGKSLINQPAGKNTEGIRTEIIEAKTNIKNPDDTPQKEREIKKQEPPDDKTVFESDTDDKTRVETMTGYPDKTVMEDEEYKTILDEGKGEPLPSFFAWLVYIDEEYKPLHDIRLTQQKTVIGKSTDADIQLNDQFASKLHAVIHFEEGKFFISDLGSSNHTRVNEKKIMNEELKDGHKIRIGHQNIIFKRVRRNL